VADQKVFPPPVRDTEFCTVVLPVKPGTGQQGRPDRQSLYICAKRVPCPDHPQEQRTRPTGHPWPCDAELDGRRRCTCSIRPVRTEGDDA
jgi:hypothetical protein